MNTGIYLRYHLGSLLILVLECCATYHHKLTGLKQHMFITNSMSLNFWHSLTGSSAQSQYYNEGIGWLAFLSGGLTGEILLQTNSNCLQNSRGCMTEYTLPSFL